MTPTKKDTKTKLMPDKYIRLNDFILYIMPDNWVVATVQTFKTGNKIGQEYSTNERYYSTMERAVAGLGEEVAIAYFPDFVRISKEIAELRDIVKKGLKI